MKQKFSTSWKGSKQPRKQRKYRANAPLHVKHKMMSVSLSKELRKKHAKRNFPLRKGDNVNIMRGEFKGKSGKVSEISLKRLEVLIDGIYRTKKDGTKVSVKFDPSNLQIKEIVLEDNKRKKALERKEAKKGDSKGQKDKKTEDKKIKEKKEDKKSEKVDKGKKTQDSINKDKEAKK